MGNVHMKRKRFGISIAVVAVLLMIASFSSQVRTMILQQYDAIRLVSFARGIALSDRAVATAAGDSTTLTFTGDELEKIRRGVSSGKSSRMPDGVYMSTPVATVTFHRGTNHLGEMSISDQLFNITGGAQFFDNSKLLNQTIYIPLRQKRDEEYARE